MDLGKACFFRMAVKFLCFAVLVVGSAAAQASDLAKGTTWLSSQIASDGSLLSEGNSIATTLQCREETLLTLRKLSAVSGVLAAAIDANTDSSTEYVARRILAANSSGQSAAADLTKLASLQNADGGWGLGKGYESDALDTAIALQALAADNASGSLAANGLTLLSQLVLPDGGWGVSDSSRIYITSNVLLAANAWSSQVGSGSAIAATATTWLLSARNPEQHYGGAFEDAIALLALAGQAGQSNALAPLMTALSATQGADGSWSDDPYITALALRAEWLAGQVPITPTAGDLTGRVVDQTTNSPLGGALIQLTENTGISAVSGSDGAFRLSNVPAATYTLMLSRSGYQSRSVTVQVTAGQTLNIGSVSLQQISTTATLNGVIKDQNGAALQNVIVTVGSKSTLTDGLGAYEVVGIPAGTAPVTATLAGYRTVSVSVSFVAGTAYQFSPTMYPTSVTPPPASVQGVVVDGKTSLPIANVSVVLKNVTQITGADGKFAFVASTTGANLMTFSANGYQPVSISLTVVSGVNDLGTVFLLPTTTTTNLHGSILDALGNPITGATVALENGPTVTSDDLGRYELVDLPGTQFKVDVDATGYVSQQFVFAVSAPGDYAQDFQLVAQEVANVTLGPLTVAPEAGAANTNLSVSSTLVNGGSAQFDGVLLLEVYDALGNLIGSGPLTDNTGVSIGAVTLLPGEALGIVGRWNTGQFAPGNYQFELRLVELNSTTRAVPLGVLIQHQLAGFTITSTTHFTGTVAGDPPVIQAGLGQSVRITSVVRNDGNVVFPSQPLMLTIADAKTGVVAFTTSASVDALESNSLANLDFGNWTPTVGGNYSLTVAASEQSLGSISGAIYVGNVAQASFTVNPDAVLAGTRETHGNIHVSGVDPAQATISDPLAPLIREAIQRAVAINDTNAHTWIDTNRCTSCHISNQALIGGELTRKLTTFSALDRSTIINNVATNQATNGSITAGFTPNSHPHTLGALTLWGLLGYHDPLELRTVYKRAADWVASVQSSNGLWTLDYTNTSVLTWFDTNISMSMLNLSSLRRTSELLTNNSIESVPIYAVQAYLPATPVSSRGSLVASPDGNLYYTDRSGPSVNLVRPDGTLVTKWTKIGTAPISDPRSVVVRKNGQVWVSSSSGTLRLNTDGTMTKLAADNMDTLVEDAAGTVWATKVGDARSIYQLDSASGKATVWLSNGPFGLSTLGRIVPNDDGTLYVTDLTRGKIFQVMPDKSVMTVTEVIQGNQAIPAAFSLLHLLKDGDHWLLSTSSGIVRLSADWIGHRITWSRADQMARLPDGSVVFVSNQTAGIQKLVEQSEDVAGSLVSYQNAISKGTTWLQAQTFGSTDKQPTLHMAQKLWGLGEAYRFYKPRDAVRASSIYSAMSTLATQLRARQASDGGWANGNSKTPLSDALVTAQVGIALDYLNPSASDPAIRKAVAWLLSQQDADGSWSSADGILATKVSTTTMVAIWLPMILDRLGAIDAQISATFPVNVQPNSFVPAPTQMSTDGAGNVTATWSLVGVTNDGVDLGFDLTMTDLQPDEVRPAASEAHMTFNNSFNEQTVTRPIDIPDVTASARVSLSVATDQSDYPANATATVTTTLVNLDDVGIAGTLVVNVYDHAGAFVGGVTQRSVTIPADGTLPITDPFFIGSIVPAKYTVKAVLSDSGRVLAQGDTTFNVLPDNASAAATSTVHTDKQVYNPSDHVQIVSHVESVSANTVLNNLSLQVSVYDKANALQYTHTYAIPQLLPGQMLDFTGIQTLSNAPPGLYAVKQNLFDSDGNLFNHVEAAYNVSSTSDTGFGFVGTIAVTPKSLPVGATLTLNASATNQGNSALTDLPLTISVVDPNQGTVLQHFDQTSTLAMGGTVPFDTTWITRGTINTTYYAVLTATIGSGPTARTLTLAVDTFDLTLKLDADLTLKAYKPSLAALVFIDSGTGANEQTQINAALASLDYAATFVTTPQDLAAGVRTGAYQLYLLLATQAQPDATTMRLVREAVHRGEGVLSANGIAQLPEVLAQMTGLTASNALPVINAQSIDVLNSAPGGAAQVALDPSMPSRIVMPEIAQTQAVLTGRLPSMPEQGTLSAEVGALGRVDIGYYGSDAGFGDTQLSLASLGRVRNADGSDRATVWRIRNSGDMARNVTLADVGGGFSLAARIASHTDAFFASPIVNGTADHRLAEATQTIQTVSALATTFSDSRLVDVGDNPGAIALWANHIGATDVLDWTGSQHVVHGAVHSNSDIRLAGAQNLIDGPVHYVTTFTNSGNQNTFTLQPRQVDAQPLPTLLDLDDFRPGGSAATAAGMQYVDASQECATSNHGWQRNASQMPLAAGLYWIPCDVHISGGNGTTSNVTLVSTGAMQIDGVKGVFKPFYRGLQFATTSISAGALQLSGDATQVGGLVFAPNGTVKISGSSLNLQCSVIGNEIRFANAKTTIDARQCPYATVERRSPAVLLNAFGDGWAAYAAFDWPTAIGKYEPGAPGELTTLFGGVLAEVAPTRNALRAGTIVPLTATVHNNNDAFTGQLALQANDDSLFVPPMVSWALDFTQQRDFQAQGNVRLGSGNSTDVTASISVATPIVQNLLTQTTATISHLPGESIGDLVAAVSAVSDPDVGLVAALTDLRAAQLSFATNDREGTLGHLLDAAEALGLSTKSEADPLRTRVDWLIWSTTH